MSRLNFHLKKCTGKIIPNMHTTTITDYDEIDFAFVSLQLCTACPSTYNRTMKDFADSLSKMKRKSAIEYSFYLAHLLHLSRSSMCRPKAMSSIKLAMQGGACVMDPFMSLFSPKISIRIDRN